MLKGQCFETPAFGVLRRLKSHEAVQVFDELRLQSLNNEVSIRELNIKSGYHILKFQIRLLNVSNQCQMPGLGSARIVKSIL